jgi:hypothetical protein
MASSTRCWDRREADGMAPVGLTYLISDPDSDEATNAAEQYGRVGKQVCTP